MKIWGLSLILAITMDIELNSAQSTNYKITNLNINSLSNSQRKLSYTFGIDGNLVDIGYTFFQSRSYGIYSGLLSTNRGPEPNVERAYVYPNPCNVKNGCRAVTFTKLSLICEIKIFNIAGEEVITLNKNSNSEKYSWDLKDKNSVNVASGLYIYHIKDPTGTVKKGKLILIR